MTPTKAIVTPDALSEFLEVPVQTLAKMRVDGTGPEFIRVNSRTIRYRWEAVEKWLTEQTHTTTDDYAA